MRGKSKLLFSVLISVLSLVAVFSAAACGSKNNGEHVHDINYDSFVYDETGHWFACSGCDEKIEKVDHTFDSYYGNLCVHCGYEATMMAETLDDGGVGLVFFPNVTGDLIVPSEWNGKTVKGVYFVEGDGVVYSSLTSVTCPESVSGVFFGEKRGDDYEYSQDRFPRLKKITYNGTCYGAIYLRCCLHLEEVYAPLCTLDVTGEDVDVTAAGGHLMLGDGTLNLVNRAPYTAGYDNISVSAKVVNMDESFTEINAAAKLQFIDVETINASDLRIIEGDDSFLFSQETLKTINAPKLEIIGAGTFSYCSLTSLVAPNLKFIGENALGGNLTELIVNHEGDFEIDEGQVYVDKLSVTAKDIKFKGSIYVEDLTVVGNALEGGGNNFDVIASRSLTLDLASCDGLSVIANEGFAEFNYNVKNFGDDNKFYVNGGVYGARFTIGNKVEVLPYIWEMVDGYPFSVVKFADDCKLKVIRGGAFADLGMEEITLPASVTTIEESAFSGVVITAVSHAGGMKIPYAAIKDCTEYSFELDNGVYYYDTVAVGIEYGYSGDVVVRDGTEYIEGNNFLKDHAWESFSLYMPDSVKEINSSLYSTDLKSVRFPKGMKSINDCLRGCWRIEEVILPTALESIGDYAFYECSYLEEIELPDTLVSIGKYAFGKTNLGSVALPNTLESLDENAFAQCDELKTVSFGTGLKILNSNVFSDCTKLNDVTFATGLVEIKEKAFGGCAFSTLTLPSSIQAVASLAFNECNSLTYINVGDGVELPKDVTTSTVYKGQSFDGLYYRGDELTGIVSESKKYFVIKSGTTTMRSGVFTGNTTIKTVYVPKNLKVPEDEFKGCTNVRVLFEGSATQRKLGIDENRVKERVTHLDENGFTFTCSESTAEVTGYYGLETEIVIPAEYDGKTVNAVAEYAFKGNTDITKVDASTIADIKGGAFMGCTALREVVTSDSLLYLFNMVFSGCTSLQTVTFGGGDWKIYSIAGDSLILVDTVKPDAANLISLLTDTYCDYVWTRTSFNF